MSNWKSLVSPTAIYGDAVAGQSRAVKVKEEIDVLKNSMGDNRWLLADLLQEAHDNNYHQDWGFNDFDEYIDQNNFDVGSREARYLIKINRNSRTVGITREQLKAVAISKLKEIFKLDPEMHKDHILRLMKAAVDMSLETVKAEVKVILGQEDDEFTWRNFRVLREAADTQVDPAIERAKREYGDTIDPESGEGKDISDGQALVCIMADYNASPDLAKHEVEQALNQEQGEGPVEA